MNTSIITEIVFITQPFNPTLGRSWRNHRLRLALNLQRYVRDDFFLYNQDCTYVLSKMLTASAPMITGDARAGAGVGSSGLPPYNLQKFVNQMVDRMDSEIKILLTLYI